MAKFTPNGLEAYLQDLTDPTGTVTPIDITTISSAAPTVIGFGTGDGSTVEIGDILTIEGTDSPLDGNSYLVSAVGTDTATLGGTDLTDWVAPGVIAGTATEIPTEAMLRFCLSGYERAIAAADAIDVSTFCGAESLAGTPLPGTITINGFIDYQVAAYNEWRKGVQDGIQRLFHIKLPTKVGGDILMMITPSGLTETFAVNEAASFEGTAVINKEPQYIMPAETA